VWWVQQQVILLCLMDFGDGGSLLGRMIGGFNEGAMMERIKGKYIRKVSFNISFILFRFCGFQTILGILLLVC